MNSISEANKHLLDMMYCAYMRVYASTYHLQLSTCVLIKKATKKYVRDPIEYFYRNSKYVMLITFMVKKIS